MPEPSPMMAQYLGLKAGVPDCLLFYRMGDFYELFFDDAAAAAATLDIALTRRGVHDGADIPMCGVPVHSHEVYLQRLIRAGHRVAIAEQIEDPKAAKARGGKAVVARAVVRIVTPGTLTEGALLDARASNWLAAVAPTPAGVGLAWCDVSTGAFRTLACAPAALAAELARIGAAEVIAPESWDAHPAVPRSPRDFDSANGEARLKAHFGVATLDAFGQFSRAECGAAGALLAYLDRAGAGSMPRLDPPRRVLADSCMAIDAATRASLELSRTPAGRVGSLLDCIDLTVTGSGGRLLADDLAGPLTDAPGVNARLDMVAWFFDASIVRARTREALKAAPDLERASARLALGRGGPRDLASVRDALAVALALKAALGAQDALGLPALLAETLDGIGAHGHDIERLRAALVPEPPVDIAKGGFIAPGYDAAVDELRTAATDGRRLVAGLETRLRADTGVASLKIRHNNVLGYHIEVAARAADPLLRADSGFTHRQTMAGAVRFGSPELHDLGVRISQAGDHALAAEAAHFEELREAVLARADAIAATARALARLDVGAALAELAARDGWVRPTVDDSCAFMVAAGRHPVVEAATRARREAFVGNDCDLSEHQRLWLLTGPNMAGKSTFLRQNALLAVLAQAGSFVPATAAHIGIVDRLFSRVGASDDLAAGRSTFMVEMVETAAILTQATRSSLVILDEVGRGTSTYDGLAIAWGVLEAVHDGLACRCLFATHYHELTRLSERLKCLSLATVRVREWQGELVFLHEVVPGAADRSYGLAVARLAGLPTPVIARAKEVLARLETQRDKTGGLAAALVDLPLFAAAAAPPPHDALRVRILAIDPDTLSARTALDLMYELRQLATLPNGH